MKALFFDLKPSQDEEFDAIVNSYKHNLDNSSDIIDNMLAEKANPDPWAMQHKKPQFITR